MSAYFARRFIERLAPLMCLGMMLGCACPAAKTVHRDLPNDMPAMHRLPPNGNPTSDVMTLSESAAHPIDSHITTTAWQSPNLAAADGAASNSIPDALPSPAASAASRVLSLREAIDIALNQNVDAVTARAGGPVNDANREVAATYPWNPTLQMAVTPYARDQAGDLLATKNSVSITQTLELAHQPRYRRQVAVATWNQQRAVITQGELTAAVAAMRGYFDASYRKGLSDVASRNAELQTRMLGVLDRRFNAGLATPSERLTSTVAARQSRRLAELASIDYQTSLRSLRVVLNLPPSEQVELPRNFTSFRWLPISNALEQGARCIDQPVDGEPNNAGNQWTRNRPDVVAAQFAVTAAQANLELARANMVPNVATGPTYERDENGTLFLGVAAQMDITAWNTGAPLVRQRTAELQQQLTILNQTRMRASLQAEAAINRYTVAYKLWETYSANRSKDEKEIASATDAFEHGQASLLEVLSIQDGVMQERKSFLDLVNEISQAAADAVAATVIDPESIVESSPVPDAAPTPTAVP